MSIVPNPSGLTTARLRTLKSQRGEGKFKAIFTLVILVLGIYCAVKLVPPYVAEYQLADKIQEQARFAIVNRYTEEQIRENVWKVMQDLEIPAKREDIKIVANYADGEDCH